ncbi:hypothetical protein LIER_43172 [Lithospermum erythrorhizon]|uniref:Uncharacterized protein n=1 Tax=Lithospermum erythrorhizon TaxID=34254 RepID=A0AAV3PMZ6_LITER
MTKNSDERTIILPKVSPCKYCGAYKFFRETDCICCSKGEITLAESILPSYLVSLITGTDSKSREFQNMIPTYNNHFAFTSIGITGDEQYQLWDHGIYTVRVQGQIHHYLNDLLPQSGSNRLTVKSHGAYPYSTFLRHALELENIEQYHIVIRSDTGLDQRRYNKPLSTEVAGIWIEDENGQYLF